VFHCAPCVFHCAVSSCFFSFYFRMVRNRQRKTSKGLFVEDDMKVAVEMVLGGCSVRRAAVLKNVNHVTLSRYVIKTKARSEENVRYAPNYSVKMQPLDVAVFGPFKTYYNAALDSWMMQNPGKTASIYNIASFVNTAHQKSMTPSNIISGFKKSGIHPFDRHIFTEADFLCNYVTDRPPAGTVDHQPPKTHGYTVPSESPNGSLPQVEEGAASNHAEINALDPGAGPSQAFLSPEDFRGYPKAGERKTDRKSRKKGKSMIATSTPEMKAIAEKKKPVLLSMKKAAKRRLFGLKNKKSAQTRDVDSSEDDDEDVQYVDTDDDMDMDEDLFAVEPDHFAELFRLPVLDDYVLVEFKTRSQSKFYVGRITR